MNLDEDFKRDIQSWISYDDKLSAASEAIKKLKEKREKVEIRIIDGMKKNKLTAKEIGIPNGRLKYSVTKSYGGITKGHLEKKLLEWHHGDVEKMREELDFLLTDRKITEKEAIKRTIFNNN